MGRDLKYLCIELSNNYFAYLEENIRRIIRYFPATQILTSKCLVDTPDGSYLLSENAGTATSVKLDNSNGLNTNVGAALTKTRLTDLVQSCGDVFMPRLIKVDVDGFDYGVINSGLKIIKDHHPIIFFECNPTTEDGSRTYVEALEKLHNAGYINFSTFDNFAEFVFSTQDIRILPDLIRYFLKQNTHTFYYIDILASTAADAAIIKSAIDEFNCATLDAPVR